MVICSVCYLSICLSLHAIMICLDESLSDMNEFSNVSSSEISSK